MIPMDGNICTPKVRSKWFSFNNVRAIFKISSCLNLNILLNKIISHFTIIPAFHPLPLPASQREHIRYVQSRVCIVSCIIVSCMIVLLVRGVRGDCSGPSDGNCARISEEREEREDRTPHSTLCSAPCPRPRVPVLGYHSRPGTLTLDTTIHTNIGDQARLQFRD